MNVVVVGAGRMGLPLACVLAKHGATVTACDVDRRLVETINAGQAPYEEPGLAEALSILVKDRRLTASTDTTAACRHAEVIVVIVPAHLTAERDIDFSILRSASADVGRGLKPDSLVIYETTVSVGGTRNHLIPVLEEHSGLRAGHGFHVAFSPERVKANFVMSRLEVTPKVVGGFDDKARRMAATFYGTYLGAPVDEVGSLEAAELTKLVGMLYRDVNIALVNELAAFSETAGIDFEKVRRAANTDGEASLLVPGIGVGGHCTPVYPYFLTHESRRRGITQRLSEAAREINDGQPLHQLRRLAAHWRPLTGRRIHIMGLGFRPDVKVDTFSPAYSIRATLLKAGACVTLEDPHYTDDELRATGFVPGVATAAEAVVLNTAHTDFASPDFDSWARSGVEAVLDGRNFWRQDEVERTGMLYFGIGRPSRVERLEAPYPPDAAKRSDTSAV